MMTAFARFNLICVLAATTAAPPGLWAQPEPRQTGTLRIYVLQGNNVINNTSTRAATSPVVEIRDEDDFPVSGATVTFELPASGPGATFEGGRLSYSNVSDSRGQASAAMMSANQAEGQFVIKVTAQFGELSGMTTIRQTNSNRSFSAFDTAVQKPSFWRRNRWLLLGVGIGGGVGLGYYFVTRDRVSGAVLSPGTVVIGGPR